ncbi:MAG: pseudouridine synthase [Bacteroidetes bacterium]|nr:pseudouridine synthase [Bacteroidota bacterium]
MHRYYVIYKPYQVLSQFTSQEGKQTLKDFFAVPNDVYAVGRLDYDSEGLLILTNDKQLNYHLLNPSFEHEREYLVQVDGDISQPAVTGLQSSVEINIDGKFYKTKKCFAEKLITAPDVPERNPPIRFRKNIPVSWVKMILTEGKNRQVRKMTAKVGFPTLRLIRWSIEQITIDGLQPGEMREISKQEIYRLLAIDEKKFNR